MPTRPSTAFGPATGANAREIDGIVLPLKMRWIGYKPGDAVTVMSSVAAMDSQLIVLRRRHLDPASGAVTFTARTETAGKHPYALGKITTPPPTPALATVDRTQLLIPGVSAAWPAITDPELTKPADNATNSADPTSPFGPDGTVGDFASRLFDMDGAINGVRVDIDTVLAPALGALSADLALAQEELDQTRSDLEAARTDLTQVRADVTAAQGDLADAVSTLTASDATIRQEITDLVLSSGEGTSAQVTDKLAALTNADVAITQRLTSVETNYGTLSGRITTAQTTASNAASSLASLTTTVQSIAGSRPNLQVNGGFERGLEGITVRPPTTGVTQKDPYWGTYIFHQTTGASQVIEMPSVPVVASYNYTVSFDRQLSTTGTGTSRVDVAYLNAAGDVLSYSEGTARSATEGVGGFSDTVRRSFVVGPASGGMPEGTTAIRLRLISENTSGTIYAVWRRIKVERGTPATAWSTEASTAAISSAVTSEALTRATADTALGSRIDTVTTNLGIANSSISTEITSRTTADTALGARIDTVVTSVGAANSRITEEATTRSNADVAAANRLTSVETNYGTLSGQVTTVQTAASNATSAVAGLTTRVQAVESSKATVASVTSEASTRATADNALGSRIDTVSSDVGSAHSRITSEVTSRTTADTALGSRIDTVNSSVGSAHSRITDEVNTRTSTVGALTVRVSTAESTLGTLGSRVTTTQNTLATQQTSIANLTTAVTAVASPNLLANGAWRNGTSGWSLNGGSWEVVSGFQPDTFIQVNNAPGAFAFTDVNVKGGLPYCFGFIADPDNAASACHMQVDFWTPGFARLAHRLEIGPSDGWNRVSFGPITIDSDVTFARVYIVARGSGTGMRRWTQIQLQQSSVPTGYSDVASLSAVGAAITSVQAAVTTQASAIADLTGRTRAFWQQSAVAGDGRVSIALYAEDGNGNRTGKVAITGDLQVDGNTVLNGSLSVLKAGYGMTGEASIYSFQDYNDNSQTTFTGLAGVGIDIHQGAPLRGYFSFIAHNLNNVGQARFRVCRVTDGTVVWGGVNGVQMEIGTEGQTISGIFMDSVPAGQSVQYDVQVACSGGANIRSTMRVMVLEEMVRHHFSQIWIGAPSGQGPGAGSQGGGQINGDTSGSGGVSGTSPSAGNAGYGGLRGRTMSTI